MVHVFRDTKQCETSCTTAISEGCAQNLASVERQGFHLRAWKSGIWALRFNVRDDSMFTARNNGGTIDSFL